MTEVLLPTTELDAVNDLLDAIGEAPVSSLDDLALDAASALNTLRRTSREVQADGWHWNTSIRKLVANSKGEFVLPFNVIRVDTVGRSQRIDVINRGGKLFDRRPFKNTTIFSETELDVELVDMLPFEQLPEVARQYIYIRAARIFQEKEVGSPSLSRFDRSDELMARANLDSDECATSDRTMLDQYAPALSRRPIGWRGFR